MTITAAWVRTLKDCKELIIISDSRLNGGKKMDCAQKVHVLPRSDAFICFAGDTSWAYPLMHQVISAISTYERSSSRAQDIVELKSHVLKVFEGLRETVHDAIGAEDIPSAEFLFGGYSWIRKQFLIWRIHFQKGTNAFEASPAKGWKDNPWIFAGDSEHVKSARKKLSELMISRKRAPHQVTNFKFNWEPFEVIRDMLREVGDSARLYKNESIGGAPQVLKIYEHLTSKYIAVRWSIPHLENSSGIYICGRKILGYERSSLWIIDPDTLLTSHVLYSKLEAEGMDNVVDVMDEQSEVTSTSQD